MKGLCWDCGIAGSGPSRAKFSKPTAARGSEAEVLCVDLPPPHVVQGLALGLGHCARRLPTRYALTRPCVSATVSVLVLTLIIMVLVLYFTCTFNESTTRFRHTHAPLDMHPLQAPLDIHPRHSPSASTLFITCRDCARRSEGGSGDSEQRKERCNMCQNAEPPGAGTIWDKTAC